MATTFSDRFDRAFRIVSYSKLTADRLLSTPSLSTQRFLVLVEMKFLWNRSSRRNSTEIDQKPLPNHIQLGSHHLQFGDDGTWKLSKLLTINFSDECTKNFFSFSTVLSLAMLSLTWLLRAVGDEGKQSLASDSAQTVKYDCEPENFFFLN